MTTHVLHDTEITLTNGIKGHLLEVQSANPATFFQAISAPDAAPAQTIYAQTFLPPEAIQPPMVIIVPGSLGIAPSHVLKAQLLTDAGIAACLLDPFGARHVTSTVANQAQFSFAASAWDVLAAVQTLAGNKKIDANRIGAQGHSRGGAAVLSAATLARLTDFDGSLAGVYAAYPWSGQQFLNPHVGGTKVRSIIGDQDEWCLPQQVQGHMQAIRLCGGAASIKIIAGAQHSFDRDTPVEMIEDASVSRGAPTIYIEDDGHYLHPVDGRCTPDTGERELMLYGIKAGYGKRGARIGSASDYADQFHADMMAFWQATLAA